MFWNIYITYIQKYVVLKLHATCFKSPLKYANHAWFYEMIVSLIISKRRHIFLENNFFCSFIIKIKKYRTQPLQQEVKKVLSCYKSRKFRILHLTLNVFSCNRLKASLAVAVIFMYLFKLFTR